MMEKLDALFEAMLWPMTPPSAYGWFHILFTLGGFAICAFAAWKLRKVSDRTCRKILFGIGLVLAISEVYKQLYYYFAVNDNAYAWGDFPFQFCSVPMYICLIAPWLKPGKLQRGMYSYAVLFNLLGGAIAFTEPSGLFHSHWFLTVHALFWHMVLVFIGLFLCFSGRGGTEKGDFKVASFTFFGLSTIAFTCNTVVQKVIGGHMNMFFVGPGNSPLIVFKWISQTFGWYVNTVVYMLVVCLGAYLVFLLIRALRKKHTPLATV